MKAGFTPIFDFVLDHYAESPTIYGRTVSPMSVASVYGVVFRFCQMDKANPRCEASAETIGLRCGLQEAVVRRCLKVLINDDWLEEHRRAGRSFVYRLTPKSWARIGDVSKKQGSKVVTYDG